MLLESYDNLSMLVVNRDTCCLAQNPNFESILGSTENVTEVNRIIWVVKEILLDTLADLWWFGGCYEAGSVVRIVAGADFLYYNM